MAFETRQPRAFGTATKSTGPEIPEIEDDLYVAKVKEVEETTASWQDSEFDQYVVEWELADVRKEDGMRMTLRSFIRIPDGLVNEGIVNENSNLYAFLRAIGYDDDGLVVDPVAWIGKKARIVVENKQIKAGANAGQVRPRITGYKPLKGETAAAARVGAPKASAAAATAVANEDDF